MTHPYAAYWDMGVDKVPQMTGALAVMDCSDVGRLAQLLGIPLPLQGVLDVGCGTGRVAPLCEGYYGVDISADAIAYCRKAGVQARVIEGANDLPSHEFKTVVCLSVFTHIGRPERLRYLDAFHRLAPWLLVDVIPGDESGDVERWTADVPTFEADLKAAGFAVKSAVELTSDTGEVHRYYYARRNG